MTPKRSGKAYYMISAVAQKYNIHPQTLRLYEREGLLRPSRTEGNTRLYSEEDLEQLETILAGRGLFPHHRRFILDVRDGSAGTRLPRG